MGLTSLESKWLACHQYNIGPSISPLHFVLALFGIVLWWLPARARGEEEAGRFVGRAAGISCAHHRVPIGYCVIEQAHRSAVHVGIDGRGELVDDSDGLQQCCTQGLVPESVGARWRARIETLLAQTVEEQSKGPFAVGRSLDRHEPLFVETKGQGSFDVLEAADAAVVHEQEAVMTERMTILIREVAFCAGSDVGEYKRGARLAGQALQIGTIPRRDGGGEDARLRAQLGLCVVSDAEAIAVVRPACVLPGGQ